MRRTRTPRRSEGGSYRRLLALQRREIDRELRRHLPRSGEAPASILRAMRYSLFAGGKRVRGVLAREACRAVGGGDRKVLPACCALEMIHTYSLIHDDLPALDDDRWRRGKPTLHRVFGEAAAVLAGDALLTLALQILAENPPGPREARRRTRVLSLVTRAVGVEGMIGGQVRDLESEGKRIGPVELARIHRGKTGALLTASAVAGGILGGGGRREIQALARYGRAVGLAFQIVDDVLDQEGTRGRLGKSPGKDRALRKATYPALWGLEKSRAMAERSAAAARRALAPLGRRAAPLARLADFIVSRDR
ncbi:MAG TPA: farnesyl diphosphate synthase [Candidatus Polarisedimenticolia bacterium]|nr:farnesyl diphosphate synthase [Candidatus Polarisedimenticolia bacterium]